MAHNIVDSSKYTKLDKILEKLPAYQKYEELNNVVSGKGYDDICKDFVINTEDVKTLCKKFLKNIDSLVPDKSIKEYTSKYFYLSHWIVDELGKIFTNNSENGARQTIDKIIYEGNIRHSKKNNKIYFLYNSDFDFKVAKEEKYLHDYFINYDNIVSCKEKTCKDYAEFVEYIKTIYYEHKEDCLGWPCDYFIHDPKYDPDDLLLKLNGKFPTRGSTRNNEGTGMSTDKLVNSASSDSDKSMIIKYINCFKINGVDGNFLGYHCEDPAYSRHKKKVLHRKKVQEQKNTFSSVKVALENINYPKCTKVFMNQTEFIGLDCKNSTSIQSSAGVGLEGNQTIPLVSQSKPEQSKTSDWDTEIFADSKANNGNSLESGNIMRGVKLVSVYRDITKNEKELDKMEAHLISENGGTNLISTLFPEVPKEYRKTYEDKDILNCKIYGREHNKLICKKTIPKNYDEIANEQESPTNGINEIIDEIEDEPDFTIPVDNIFDIFKSKIFRNIVTAALTLGMFIVIFIYYKVYKNYILIYLY
ncbi:hypothetical protein PVIIG_00840 [Plasmodium vivax India VII]|uniref:Uncharacterized protein n=1 Tax=Plasmodium vivax India VII TaxID=1077284 RepID=A0A0J9SA39_PLAVI|nr:hypothetical protein PVIIG_00840 [Plasmodium vivax India VII]